MNHPNPSRCSGDRDSIEYKACVISIHWDGDPDMGPPWEEDDGHGVALNGRETFGPWFNPDGHGLGERYPSLSPHRFGASDWYYDLDASLEVARRDQWGLSDDDLGALALRLDRAPTDDEIVEAAVQADFEHLRAWCHDEWSWLCADVLVDVHTVAGDCFVKAVASLGGIESGYASSYIDELVIEARAWINENQAAIAAIASSHIALEEARQQLTPCS